MKIIIQQFVVKFILVKFILVNPCVFLGPLYRLLHLLARRRWAPRDCSPWPAKAANAALRL